MTRSHHTLGLAALALWAGLAVAQPRASASGAPAATIEARLSTPDAARGNLFGYAVALDADRALIGAASDDAAGNAAGAATLFAHTAGEWAPEATLRASDPAAGDYFGISVALDGDRALVGAYERDGGRGAAYVFVRTAAGWEQEAVLTTAGTPGDRFGVSVALDGDRALIGAHGRGGAGAALVFERGADGWAEAATLTAPDGAAGDQFGWAVALDGRRAIVGAYGADAGRGAAYVYGTAGGAWVQEGRLTAQGAGPGDNLGVSVALHDDRALAGAPFNDAAAVDAGAAVVFEVEGGAWVQADVLTAPAPDADDYFGWAVALNDAYALVGSRLDDEAGVNAGTAYLFAPSAGSWVASDALVGAPTPGANAGLAVALTNDRALVGAPYHDGSRGLAQVFSLVPASGAVSGETGASLDLGLSAFPNPAAHRARVAFGLADAGAVRVSVHDALGREVARLADGPLAAGRHEVPFDVARLAPGVYVVHVASPSGAGALRVTVAR